MSDPHEPLSPLADDQVVYRTLTGKRWVDRLDGSLSVQIFLRRPSDTDGISLDTVLLAKEDITLDCIGVVGLRVRDIRVLGLEVERDSPTHAYIVGLPWPDEDRRLAEELAANLVEHCQLVWYDPAWYGRRKQR